MLTSSEVEDVRVCDDVLEWNELEKEKLYDDIDTVPSVFDGVIVVSSLTEKDWVVDLELENSSVGLFFVTLGVMVSVPDTG